MLIKILNLTNKKIAFFLMLVIFLRLYLILLPSFRIDMTDWQAWSDRLVNIGPTNFYAEDYFSDYFPGYLYLLWFLGESFNFIFPHLSIFSLGFEFYLKLITNFFDFVTAYYIYKIISKHQKDFALPSTILYLLNPALTFNSSVWGQVDGILTFFLIYSTYSLLELKRIYQFSISTAISILVKPQGLAIFPITITYLLANFKSKKYFSVLIIPFLLIIFSLPFFLKDPILGLFHLFEKSTNIYPYTSMFSYNFWHFSGWWVDDSIKFQGISYQVWGIILYFLSLFFILFPLIFKKGCKNNYLIYFASALAIFAFFLFLTRIHERYFFPFFAFLLIASMLKRSLKLIAIYIMLSLIHFINLWYVYYYYNFVYVNPNSAPLLIYQLINSNAYLFTIVNLFCFGSLIFLYYIRSYTKKNHV